MERALSKKKELKNKIVLNEKLNIDAIWINNDSQRTISLEPYIGYIKNDNDMTYSHFYFYRPKAGIIGFVELKELMGFLHKLPTNRAGVCILPICIDLNNIRFYDKLIYILLETIIYYLISEKGWIVTIGGQCKEENCSTNVGFSSLNNGNWPLNMLFENDFNKKINYLDDIRKKKYKYNRIENATMSSTRCLVNNEKAGSSISSDIYEFLKRSFILKKIDCSMINCIAKTIIEIKDNCAEHTKFPYVYDIDIKKVTHAERSMLKGREYIAINVAIWDFSGIRLGDAIKKKIQIIEMPQSTQEDIDNQIGRKIKPFEKLRVAKEKHKLFWDSNYDEDDFFSLTAFQPGITGRTSPGSTGGAGLSHVLDFLCDFPDYYRGYCLTGNTVVNFDKKFLNKDNQEWYSFRDNNSDFVNNKPSDMCVYKSKFFYPGTAFFLHLELNNGG